MTNFLFLSDPHQPACPEPFPLLAACAFSIGACNRLVRGKVKSAVIAPPTPSLPPHFYPCQLQFCFSPPPSFLLPPSKASPTPIGFAILLLLRELRLVGRTFPPDIRAAAQFWLDVQTKGRQPNSWEGIFLGVMRLIIFVLNFDSGTRSTNFLCKLKVKSPILGREYFWEQ